MYAKCMFSFRQMEEVVMVTGVNYSPKELLTSLSQLRLNHLPQCLDYQQMCHTVSFFPLHRRCDQEAEESLWGAWRGSLRAAGEPDGADITAEAEGAAAGGAGHCAVLPGSGRGQVQVSAGFLSSLLHYCHSLLAQLMLQCHSQQALVVVLLSRT